MARDWVASKRSQFYWTHTLAVGFLAGAISAAASQDGYVRPKPGQLFVIASDYRTRTGQLLTVDTAEGRVLGRTIKGYEPDMAVSPDGTTLFVAYINGSGGGGTIEFVDAASGRVTWKFTDPKPWPSNGMAYTSRLALSRDGSRLFHYKADTTAEEGNINWFETIDTLQRTRLPERVMLPQCGVSVLLPGPTRDMVVVACSDTQDVRVFKVSDKGSSIGTPTRWSLGGGGSLTDRVTALMSADGRVLTILRSDGVFRKIDLFGQFELQRDALDREAREVPYPSAGAPLVRRTPVAAGVVSKDWLAGRQLRHQIPAVSSDGAYAYLLSATGVDGRAVTDQVDIINLATMKRAGSFALPTSCVSLTVSRDGRTLFAVDQLNASILVMDTSGRLERRIENVGVRPSFAIVALR